MPILRGGGSDKAIELDWEQCMDMKKIGMADKTILRDVRWIKAILFNHGEFIHIERLTIHA